MRAFSTAFLIFRVIFSNAHQPRHAMSALHFSAMSSAAAGRQSISHGISRFHSHAATAPSASCRRATARRFLATPRPSVGVMPATIACLRRLITHAFACHAAVSGFHLKRLLSMSDCSGIQKRATTYYAAARHHARPRPASRPGTDIILPGLFRAVLPCHYHRHRRSRRRDDDAP